MTHFDAIVIGGGVNGLTAAMTLAKRGKSVCIVEKSAQMGGMAAFAQDDAPALAHTLYNLSPVALKEFGLDAKKHAGTPLNGLHDSSL